LEDQRDPVEHSVRITGTQSVGGRKDEDRTGPKKTKSRGIKGSEKWKKKRVNKESQQKKKRNLGKRAGDIKKNQGGGKQCKGGGWYRKRDQIAKKEATKKKKKKALLGKTTKKEGINIVFWQSGRGEKAKGKSWGEPGDKTRLDGCVKITFGERGDREQRCKKRSVSGAGGLREGVRALGLGGDRWWTKKGRPLPNVRGTLI